MLGEGVNTFIQYIRKSSALNSSQFSSSADGWELCSFCSSIRVVECTPHASMMAAGNRCPRQRESSLHYCAVWLGPGQTCTAFLVAAGSPYTHCTSRRNPARYGASLGHSGRLHCLRVKGAWMHLSPFRSALRHPVPLIKVNMPSARRPLCPEYAPECLFEQLCQTQGWPGAGPVL